jgi:hypothetical protein
VYMLSLMMEDEASIHALLSFSGYNLLNKRQKSLGLPKGVQDSRLRLWTSEASTHLFEAVRLMNKKFEDAKETLSTTSIMTTVVLAGCTAFIGDAAQLMSHHDGHVRMVELRGGIDTLPRFLAHGVSRGDSMMSWSRQSIPQLPMYKSRFRMHGKSLISVTDVCNGLGSEFLRKDPRYQRPNPLHRVLQRSKFAIFLWDELFSIACDMHGLSYMLDLHFREPGRIGSIEREFFEDTFAAVQHSLVSFPLPTPDIETSVMYYRQHCWRLGGFVYFNTAIRQWEPGSGPLRFLTSQLIEALQESDLSSKWGPTFSEILLWILFTGYCGAQADFEKGWFALEMRRVVNVLDLKSLEDTEALLRSLLWRDVSHREILRQLWEEIMQ